MTQPKLISPALVLEMTTLQARMRNHGLGPSAFARKAGINDTVWSKILNGKYPDTKGLAAKLEKARKTALMIESAGVARATAKQLAEIPFVETQTWGDFLAVVDQCSKASQESVEDVLVWLVGESGSGKDRFMNELVARRGGVKIQAKVTWKTSLRAALADIASALGLPSSRTAAATLDAIINALREVPRPVCFTEVSPLTISANLAEVWKMLANLAGSVIVIAATPHSAAGLQKLLLGKGDQGDVWKQVQRRSQALRLTFPTAQEAEIALSAAGGLQAHGKALAIAAQASGYGWHHVAEVARLCKSGFPFDKALLAYGEKIAALN